MFRFRSPLRGPWLTSVFGALLLVSLPVLIITGLMDYVAYGPGQGIPGDVGFLHLPRYDQPTDPAWLFRLTQGVHVGLGIVIVPIVLAKLWSVIPKLFEFPPVRNLVHALERVSLLLLVGSILFEIATGLLNLQYDYVFGFSFYLGHYIGAWVFIGSFVAHVILKLPTMLRGLRSRSFRDELSTPLCETLPEEDDGTGLVALDPAPATISRRGVLALVGGGSALMAMFAAGEALDGPWRRLAFLLPRGDVPADSAGFPVNRTAVAAGVTRTAADPAWRLSVTGPTPRSFSRAELAALPQHTAELPMQCVEGWSTNQTWTGVRLADLAALAGVPRPTSAFVASLEKGGPFGQVTLLAGQCADPDSLLALQVGGEDLPVDHGYPARVVIPAAPAVHCTKWVTTIDFRSA